MIHTDQEAGELTTKCQQWLRLLRHYLGFMLIANLVWEVLQLPLYTLWREATLAEQAFAILHCTGGDLLIGLSALTITWVLLGSSCWPRDSFHRVAILASMIGVGYTIYSERLNTLVRESWAYSDWMPVITLFDFEVGLSPIPQWVIIPPLALWWSRRSLFLAAQRLKDS